jgi:tRNA(Ile)-lysidine synthase
VLAVRVEVTGPGGPEGAARAARYGALARAAEPLGAHVLLGHTLDDQAETVLLGLGRGSGPRSIAGMAGVDGYYRRPLLGLRRATTQDACAALGLDPWDDPHNADPAFQRARIRHEALPLLEDVLHGGVAEALARTAGLLGDDLAALDAWADQVVRASTGQEMPAGGQLSSPSQVVRASTGQEMPAGGQLEVGALAELPRAVRTRVLRAWCGLPLSAERTAALDALVTDWHGQGPVALPGGHRVARQDNRLRATAPADNP